MTPARSFGSGLWLVVSAGAAVVFLCGVLADQGQAQDGGQSGSRAAKVFQSRCASCHTVPDTRFETDKAWLGQVLETA